MKVLKGLTTRFCTHGSQEPTLGVILMKELGTEPFKSYYFLVLFSTIFRVWSTKAASLLVKDDQY